MATHAAQAFGVCNLIFNGGELLHISGQVLISFDSPNNIFPLFPFFYATLEKQHQYMCFFFTVAQKGLN